MPNILVVISFKFGMQVYNLRKGLLFLKNILKVNIIIHEIDSMLSALSYQFLAGEGNWMWICIYYIHFLM